MQDTSTARVFSPTKLREAAEAAGLTQQAVAIRLGMSMRGVQNWFLGERSPSGVQLVALSELLDREPGWFYVDPKPEEAAA